MSVGLLLTANAVPCGAHAKRQPLGLDVRPRQILATSFHDHTVQDLHLTSTFKKTKRHQKVFEADGFTSSSLHRLRSEPSLPSFASGVDRSHISTSEILNLSTAPSKHYKPVWQCSEHVPLRLDSQSQSVRMEPGATSSMRSTRTGVEKLGKQSDYVEEMKWNSKWSFKRNKNGNFWQK
eukprot:symbB.v1.2.008608.t1/scaffold541.1/size189716/4